MLGSILLNKVTFLKTGQLYGIILLTTLNFCLRSILTLGSCLCYYKI